MSQNKKKVRLTQPNILNNFKLDQAIKMAKKYTENDSTEEAKAIYNDILRVFPKNKKALEGIKFSMYKLGKNGVITSTARQEISDEYYDEYDYSHDEMDWMEEMMESAYLKGYLAGLKSAHQKKRNRL